MSWIAEAHTDWHTAHGWNAVCPLDCGAGEVPEDYDEDEALCANCDGPLTTGYNYCERCRILTGRDYVPVAERKAACCDGTGWTGNDRERCVEHYEPVDPIWFGR